MNRHWIMNTSCAVLLCASMFSGCATQRYSSRPEERTASYNLTIPGTAAWTDTGINIPAGSRLKITASGTVTYGASPGQQSGPNGGDMGTQFESGSVLRNAVVVSLIGKIGGTTAVGDGTPVPAGIPGNGAGFVGSSYNQKISTGGRLFLGFNDHVDGFWDNSGAFSVTVDVHAVPKP